MARFPVYDRSQGLSGGRTASFASSGAFTAPGRALANAGAAAQNAGAQLTAKAQEQERKVGASIDDSWFSKARAETAMEMQRFNRDTSQAATGGADGHVDNVRGHLQEVKARQLDAAPSDRAKQMFDSWSFEEDARQTTTAAQFQADAVLKNRVSDLSEAVSSHSRAILDDPSQYETVFARAMDDMEGAKQWMTPEQETTARDETIKLLNESYHKARIKSDPAGAAKDLGVVQGNATGDASTRAAALLRGFEGFRTGTYFDVNAHRTGYGSDTITKADGSIQSVRKGDKVSRADAERDLARRTTEFENAAIKDVGGKEWSSLPENARAALISIAYNYGSLPNNVVSAIKTGDLGVIANSVDKLKSHNGGVNSKRRGKEAAIIRGEAGIAASNKTIFADNPRFAGMTAEDVIGLQQGAESELASLIASQKAANTAALADTKGAFQLGIATGDSAVTQQSILSSGLDDADKAQLVNSLDAAHKDKRIAAEYADKIDMGAALDPYDSDDKKGAGLVYDAVTNGANVMDDQQAQRTLDYIYSRTGIVPSSAVNDLRRGLGSREADSVATAASLAARLYDQDANGLSAAADGGELEKAASQYKYLTEVKGYDHDTAGQTIMDMNDPEKRRQREAVLSYEPVKKAIKDIDTNTVIDALPVASDWFDAEFQSEALGAFAVSEYRDIFKDKVVEANGDVDMAHAMTEDIISKRYGVSEFVPKRSNEIIRYPVESQYEAIDGSHEWIAEQLDEAFQDEGYTVTNYDPLTGETNEFEFNPLTGDITGIQYDAGEIFLMPSTQTEQEKRAGMKPGYKVLYTRGNVLHEFPGAFYPDAAKAKAKSDAAKSEANAADRADAKEFRKTPPENASQLGSILPPEHKTKTDPFWGSN